MQKILDIIQQAKTDAAPKDEEEEYDGRIVGILFDALDEIEKLAKSAVEVLDAPFRRECDH